MRSVGLSQEEARKIWLQEMTWKEVKKACFESGGIILLPVGSTEQHGLHLPVGTDTYVAIALAEDAAKHTGVPIAPPLWFGWSPHHMAYPGTVSVRPGVLVELLYDIVASLAKHGFSKFIIINGHRIANLPWLQLAAERAQRELGVRVVIFDPAYMSKEVADDLGFGPVGHADEIETSHMLYKYPELVRLEEARDHVPHARPLYHVDPRELGDTLCYVPSREEDVAKLAEVSGGAVGRPSTSDAEKGRVYHEHLVARLIQVIEDLRLAR